LALTCASLALILNGCMSAHNSVTPRFYMLQAMNENQVSQKIDIASDLIIGVGPVKIPEYLNRSQMVTQNNEKMLQFAEFDRWGEALDLGLSHLIREDLTVMLPRTKFILYPWSPYTQVKYQVVAEIVQLNSDLKKNLFLVVQWQIIDMQKKKTMIIKRTEYLQPIIPQDYSGLAKTLSTVCGSLSNDIAEVFRKL
jgi:uncharacterized lipoprotein YmbA